MLQDSQFWQNQTEQAAKEQEAAGGHAGFFGHLVARVLPVDEGMAESAWLSRKADRV